MKVRRKKERKKKRKNERKEGRKKERQKEGKKENRKKISKEEEKRSCNVVRSAQRIFAALSVISDLVKCSDYLPGIPTWGRRRL